jgi:hypothetical protein
MDYYDIFLSHSNKDKKNVGRLAKDLRSFGLKVWLDEWSIKVGDPITQSIEMGIKNCKYMGIWLTKYAVSSGWVQREWQAKYNQEVSSGQVSVLPLLADDCDIPDLLKDKRYADFRCNYSEGLKTLLNVFNLIIHENDIDSIKSFLLLEESLIDELTVIKEETLYLWPSLTELKPYNRQTRAEIKETTFKRISQALDSISSTGNLSFSTKWAYDLPSTNERVMTIQIKFISDLLIKLIWFMELKDGAINNQDAPSLIKNLKHVRRDSKST